MGRQGSGVPTIRGFMTEQLWVKYPMDKKGFIAVFEKALDRALISECVASWLERFEKVEQMIPKMEGTLEVKEPSEIMWEENLQFRVTNGDQFAWVYVS